MLFVKRLFFSKKKKIGGDKLVLAKWGRVHQPLDIWTKKSKSWWHENTRKQDHSYGSSFKKVKSKNSSRGRLDYILIGSRIHIFAKKNCFERRGEHFYFSHVGSLLCCNWRKKYCNVGSSNYGGTSVFKWIFAQKNVFFCLFWFWD